MKYYKLLFEDSNDDDNIICICDETYGLEQYELKEGKIFSGWNEKIEFYYDSTDGGTPTDYLVNNLGWFIVSQNLRNLMEQLEESKLSTFQ